MISIAFDSTTSKFPHAAAQVQLLDQVAIGQVTPGHSATFISYLLQGGCVPLLRPTRRETPIRDGVNIVGLRIVFTVAQYRFLEGCHEHSGSTWSGYVSLGQCRSA